MTRTLKNGWSYLLYFLMPSAGYLLMMLMLKIQNAQGKLFQLQSLNFLIFFQFLQASLICSLVLKDREENVQIRIATSPIKKIKYALGSGLACMGILSIQSLISLSLITFLIKGSSPSHLIPLLGIFIVIGFSAASMSTLLISLSRDINKSNLILNFFIQLTCLMGGTSFPLDFMSPKMQKISWFLPQRWGVKTLEALFYEPKSTVFLRLLVIILFGILYLVIYELIKQRREDII